MRLMILTVLTAFAATPLAAQPGPAPAPQAAPSAPTEIPAELSDPALTDKLGRMAGVLAKAMMDLPAGEIEAAIENRAPTEADRRRRVGDAIGGPEAEKALADQVAASGPQMRAMQKALVASLPALLKSLGGVQAELEKAVANLPDPTYPKR